MTFYSSTTTTTDPSTKTDDVKFEVTETHHVIVVAWKHCYPETMQIKVTKSPLKIEVSSFDGINHHSLELNLTINREIITLKEAFYKTDVKGFLRIHIPKKNMKIREMETVSLPKEI